MIAAAQNAHEVRDDRQDRRHQHAGNHARHHELPDRIGAERAQRVDLIGHDHRAELGGDAGSDAAGEHQRGQHGPELLHHRRADEPADDRPRAELIERQAALQRQHGTREDARQQHDGERADADGLELLDDVVKIERPRERTADGGPAELDVFLNFREARPSASCPAAFSTSAPSRPHGGEPQLAPLQRLDLVTQRRRALEIEIRGRLAHLRLQLFNARIELVLAQVGLAVLHDGRRPVVEVVDAQRTRRRWP